ncbi:winged helix-turn-helix transcriptional regulator [Alphaproteobacteria bacterium HT1-32]|nr:winged helix-turn-helix transcriptional regulator [Alphaproteobacteria bacterium HT1-32]|tara:strand:- start:67966 stop:68427 length:462 start_codon:yes stop_codon:yes gene_type:complete
MKLDNIDKNIIRALQGDGRLSNQELSERVGLSPSPCLRRLRALESAGVIEGYAAKVSQNAVGLPVSVFVSVKLEHQVEEQLDRFEATLRECPEVLECYLMTGPRDYLLRIVARDLADYERFLKETLTRIPGVASIESSFALRQVKASAALPLG